MRLVIVESPFSAATPERAEVYRLYLQAAMMDSLSRGEAPFASHLLYTQVLDDAVPAERALGIRAGLAWGTRAEATVVYRDFGLSRGMLQGMASAHGHGRPIEFRELGGFWARCAES